MYLVDGLPKYYWLKEYFTMLLARGVSEESFNKKAKFEHLLQFVKEI
jgi:hypothetical protein